MILEPFRGEPVSDAAPAPAPTLPARRLAAARGIEPGWRDNWGGVHPTQPRTAAGILTAMGIAGEPPSAARRELARLTEAAWCERLPPVLVVSAAAPPARFPLALPRAPGAAAGGCGDLAVTVEADRGERRATRGGLRVGRDRAARRAALPQRHLGPLGIPLPGPFPLGTTRCASRRAAAAGRSSPARCP